MTQKSLINRIKLGHDLSVRSVMKNLHRPVGREPRPRLVDLSEWFNALPPRDKARVEQIVQLATHHSIFGVLFELDGGAIKGHPRKGTLELFHRFGKRRQMLTGAPLDCLCTIYHYRLYDQVFGSRV